MSDNKGYKKLKIWERAHILATEIYKVTMSFPREELYGITSQIRRAAFSVPLNITEGQASSSKKEFLSFLNIANRSLVETEYLLELSLTLGFLCEKDYERLDIVRYETGILLNAFIKSLKFNL